MSRPDLGETAAQDHVDLGVHMVDSGETADQDHIEADLNMIPTVPLADVLAFAEALRAALTLPAGADDWALSGRMAEVRGALAAVAFDGCTPAAASRVLGRFARGEVTR